LVTVKNTGFSFQIFDLTTGGKVLGGEEIVRAGEMSGGICPGGMPMEMFYTRLSEA